MTTSATSRLSIGDVRPAPKGSRIVPSLAIDSAAQGVVAVADVFGGEIAVPMNGSGAVVFVVGE